MRAPGTSDRPAPTPRRRSPPAAGRCPADRGRRSSTIRRWRKSSLVSPSRSALSIASGQTPRRLGRRQLDQQLGWLDRHGRSHRRRGVDRRDDRTEPMHAVCRHGASPRIRGPRGGTAPSARSRRSRGVGRRSCADTQHGSPIDCDHLLQLLSLRRNCERCVALDPELLIVGTHRDATQPTHCALTATDSPADSRTAAQMSRVARFCAPQSHVHAEHRSSERSEPGRCAGSGSDGGAAGRGGRP